MENNAHVAPQQNGASPSTLTYVGTDEEELPQEKVIHEADDSTFEETNEANEQEAIEEEVSPEPEPQPEVEQVTKRKHKLEARFSELTRRQNEAMRVAEEERSQRLRLEEELATLRQNSDARPQYENYDSPIEFAEALAKYEANKARAEAVQQVKTEQEQIKQQQVAQAWQEKIELAKKHYEDFDLVVNSATAQVSDQIQQAIIESDLGADLLYRLADDDALVSKLNRLSPTLALKELGKIEASIEQEKAKPKVVKTSNAPDPINPIKQSTTIKHEVMPSGDIQVNFLDDYRKLRASGKIR